MHLDPIMRYPLMILATFVVFIGIKIKMNYMKRPENKYYKDWKKYSNYNSIIYVVLGVLWIIALAFNVFSTYMWLPFLASFIVNNKFGIIKKSNNGAVSK